MKEVHIQNKTRPLTKSLTAQYCDTFMCRLRGLTFRKSLPPNWGLLLVQSKDSRIDTAIHMLWMKIDLAIVWINSDFEVVDVQPAYKWKSFITPKKTRPIHS